MPRIVNARVTRPDGTQFEAKIANLTLASVFLITGEPLAFRQRVHITLLGVAVEAEIAFVIAQPRLGAVAVFSAPKAVRDVLAPHLRDIEALAIAFNGSNEMEQLWGDPTTAAGLALDKPSIAVASASLAEATVAPPPAPPPPPASPSLRGMLPSLLPPAMPMSGLIDPTPHLGAPAPPREVHDSNENLRWSDRTAPHVMQPAALPQGSGITSGVLDAKIAPAGRPDSSLERETDDELKLVDIDTEKPYDPDASMEHIDMPTPQNMPVMNAQPDLYKRPPLRPKKRAAQAAPPTMPAPAPAPAPPAPVTAALPRQKREDPTLPDTPLSSLGGVIPVPEKIPPDPSDTDPIPRRTR